MFYRGRDLVKTRLKTNNTYIWNYRLWTSFQCKLLSRCCETWV